MECIHKKLLSFLSFNQSNFAFQCLNGVYVKRVCLFSPATLQVCQHDCRCHPNLRKPHGWALSSSRARRQLAVWETGWKNASVNTPRPHVVPGQRGWPLSRHICTQSLSFWGSQPRSWSRVQEGEESFPDGGNLWRQRYWWSRWHLREAMKG